MKKLMHLKHWQLFLLTFGLIIVLYIGLIAALIATNLSVLDTGPEAGYLAFVVVFVIGWFLALATLYGWMWTMGTELYKKLPEGVEMKIGFFKFAVIFPMVYILLILLFVFGMASAGNDPSPLFILIIIPHLFAMFCMFYVLWFNAKALKSVELGRRARSGDYIGEFFLMWFLFIGIWFIQPKLNRIFGQEEEGLEKHMVG